MRFTSILLLLVGLMGCGSESQPAKAPASITESPAQGAETEPSIEVNARQTDTNPTTPDEYDSLFKSLDTEAIRQLKFHQHKGISLRAAWIEFVSAATEPKDGERRKTVEPFRAHRFLGFVEGRLGVSVPRFWETTLLSARPDVYLDGNRPDNGSVTFPRQDHLFYQKTESGLSAPPGVSLKEGPEDWLLTVGNKSIRLPVSLLKELTDGHLPDGYRECIGVTALLSADDCYLVLHSVACEPYKLVHLDPRTRKVRWKVDVEAHVRGFVTGGTTYDFTDWRFHWVTLVEKNGVLFVFGVSMECVYIEAFRTKDGTNLFRFSTGY